MSLRRAAWGVDLTSGVLRAVWVARRGPAFEVLDVLELPWSAPQRGSARLDVHVPPAALAAVQAFLTEAGGRSSDPVFVGIHAHGAEQGQLALPPLEGQSAQRVLEFELRQHLRHDPDLSIVRVGRARSGARERVLTFAALRQAVVQPFWRDLRQAGCPVDGLVPEPIALARFLEVAWPGSGERLALQVQRLRTDLVYLHEQGFRFRSLPLGAGGLTGFTAGSRTPPLVEVRALAERLAREHRQAVQQWFGGLRFAPPGRVLLLGDGAVLDTLREALGRTLGREPEVLERFPRFHLARRAGLVPQDLARMGSALGLAVGALKRPGEAFSLLPPPARRRSRRLRPALAVSLLLVAAALLVLRVQATLGLREVDQLRQASDHSAAWADAERARELVAAAGTLGSARAQLFQVARDLSARVALPRRFLEALAGPTVFFRLRSLKLEAIEAGDRVTVVLEVPGGLPGAAGEVQRWVVAQLALEAATVTELVAEEDALQVAVQGILPRREAVP